MHNGESGVRCLVPSVACGPVNGVWLCMWCVLLQTFIPGGSSHKRCRFEFQCWAKIDIHPIGGGCDVDTILYWCSTLQVGYKAWHSSGLSNHRGTIGFEVMLPSLHIHGWSTPRGKNNTKSQNLMQITPSVVLTRWVYL